MKKSIFRIILLTLALITLSATLFSCGGDEKEVRYVASSDELHEATGLVKEKKGSVVVYEPTQYDVYLTEDFTIRTDDEFFDRFGNGETRRWEDNGAVLNLGRTLKNMTLDGQGHTITIKGTADGKLGYYSRGLFAEIINCTIKNLNIVYDIDLNISGDINFGGLAGDISGTSITNCTVSYKRDAIFTGCAAGGIAGIFKGTMENCSANGNFTLKSTDRFGAIAGTVSSGSVKKCNAECTIKATKLHDSWLGGLVGGLGGELSSCKITLGGLSATGETDKWTNYDAYIGGIVGKNAGNLHDCMVELKDNAFIQSSENSSSIFSTRMYTGAAVGYTTQGSKVKSIFIDAKGDGVANIRFPSDSRSINLGIHKNESTEVEKIYYAEDVYVLDYSERATLTPADITTAPDGIGRVYSFTILDKACTARTVYELNDDDVYELSALVITLDGEEITLTDLTYNSLDYLFTDDVDGYRYTVRVQEGELFVDYSRVLIGVGLGGASLVTEYSEIDFGGETGVIGGAESAWNKDANGKPVLK